MASYSMNRLEGKVAIITGGASGIGAATAKLFVRQGAKVIVTDVQDELGRLLCCQVGTQETVTYVHCDVSCESDVQNVVDLAVSKYGKLDIMYNNAAITGEITPSVLDATVEDFRRVLDVNLMGAFLGAKHAARVMIPARKGCILFTASLASLICAGVPHAYNAAKHGVVGMTKNLCVELGEYGIRVNCISPHGVATPMLRGVLGNVDKSRAEELVCETAVLKEVKLEEEDVANVALFLASDEAKYLSGINVPVDGGYSLTNPSFQIAMKNFP